ncbi:MAG: Gfo/Idh/MocA family protein, partial [Niabella sp.]
MHRRNFVKSTAATGAGLLLAPLSSLAVASKVKIKVALVGTGSRGSSLWGTTLKQSFANDIEFVGLSDINAGRLQFVKKLLGVNCPAFTNVDEMLGKIKADFIMVTTVDATHDEIIVKALNKGFNVITEKPMTTDEQKCKQILDAEKRSGKKVIVTFNYRHSVHNMRLKEILATERIGDIVSVDFNWYLNTYHGADYFRRWHGITAKSGSLWVHKATHHFDLLNWWLNSEPVEVMAYGALNFYGKNNSFRGKNCRACEHQSKCEYYWDITKNQRYVDLYVKNESYDGYLRDGCVWRTEIDLYDKMSAHIKYSIGVIVNYSLTSDSPYDGWQLAFNGKKGRVETWEDIPYLQKVNVDQSK